VATRQHRTSSPVSAVQDRCAVSFALTGSDGELLTRDIVVVKDPIASNPVLTENVAEADPPAGMAEKSHCTARPVV